MNPKNSVVLYRSKTLSDGTHPVMLQVFYDKKRKYYNTGVSGKEKEWDTKRSRFKNCRPKCLTSKPCSKCRRNTTIDWIQLKYDNAIAEFRKHSIPFNWVELDIQLKGNSKHSTGSVLSVFEEKITDIKRGIADRSAGVGSLRAMTNTRNLLELFIEAKGVSSNIGFRDVDYNFLISFESYLKSSDRYVYKWMRKTNTYVKRPAPKGLSPKSIGIHMRNLRTIWNMARRKKLTQGLEYPFSSYTIKAGTPIKTYRHLSPVEINKIVAYQGQIKDPRKHESLLLWLASYYSNGANMADMCRWKWGEHAELENGVYTITYQRTKNRAKENQPIANIADVNLSAIIGFFESKTPSGYPFVFPVLVNAWMRNGEALTDEQIHAAYDHRKKNVIEDMREICGAVEIHDPHQIDWYVARHSWAVNEYLATKDIYLVSRKLLHKHIATTQVYLESLGAVVHLQPSKASEASPFTLMQKV